MKYILLLLVLPLYLMSGSDFYRLESDPAVGLPADKIYPAGRLMPYTAYSAASEKLYDQGGLNLIGMGYGAQLERAAKLASARNLPLAAVVRGRSQGKVLRSKDFDDKNLDVDALIPQVRAEARRFLDEHGDRIVWWCVTPEEMRYWRKKEMEFLGKAAAAIRELDPRKRPVFMYEPCHRNAAALARTGKFQDLFAKGMYTNYSGHKDQRIWVRYAVEQCLEARKMLGRPDMMILSLPEMFQDPADKTDLEKIPAWVRHDVYLSLISGARGVLIYSYAPRKGFTAYDRYLETYAQIGRELNGPPGLGQVLLFGRKDGKLNIKSTVPVKLTLDVASGKIHYEALTSYEVLHNSGRYLFLVNSSSADTLCLSLSGFPEDAVATDVFSGKSVPGKDLNELKLSPLEVKILKFTGPNTP